MGFFRNALNRMGLINDAAEADYAAYYEISLLGDFNSKVFPNYKDGLGLLSGTKLGSDKVIEDNSGKVELTVICPGPFNAMKISRNFNGATLEEIGLKRIIDKDKLRYTPYPPGC